MIQSLKDISLTKKIGYALASTGICATLILGVLGCGTNNSEYRKQRFEQALDEAVQSRRKAIYTPGSFGSNSPIGAEKYKAQDRSTIGERGPNFKDYSEAEMDAARAAQEESEIPRRDTPLRIPPGYNRERTL